MLEDGVRRQERWDYPEEVIREAVVNAIVHRDYLLSGSDIELSIYSDRLEIVSPGRLGQQDHHRTHASWMPERPK